MLHYTPQHVSSSTLLIIRRANCIITASGIVTLCKQPYSMRVESSPPTYCTAAYRGWRYQRLWWYNWSSWWWAARCSKHVEECSVTYVLLKIKRIVHLVGTLKSLYYDARSEKHQIRQGIVSNDELCNSNNSTNITKWKKWKTVGECSTHTRDDRCTQHLNRQSWWKVKSLEILKQAYTIISKEAENWTSR